MAKRSRPTFQKRQKEQARQQKQKDKAARRLEAKQRRSNAESGMGETPLDWAGSQHGPQPIPAPGDRVSDHEEP
jgi:hypothetical protein